MFFRIAVDGWRRCGPRSLPPGGRTLFSKCPLCDRGDLTCALLCAVLSGQKCSQPEDDNGNSPAAQSDKGETASSPDAKRLTSCNTQPQLWERVSGRMKSSRDEASWARPALNHGLLAESALPNRFGREFTPQIFCSSLPWCQDSAGRNWDVALRVIPHSHFGTNPAGNRFGPRWTERKTSE